MNNSDNTGKILGANDSVVSILQELVDYFHSFVTVQNLIKILLSLICISLFILIYRIITSSLAKISSEKVSLQKKVFIQKFVKYLCLFLALMLTLSFFGIKLSAIWGAAGVAGVALGFAAQTSISNVISGFFVLTEGSLKIGDVIVVGNETGVIDSINLLCIRIHTFDNQMVRIPNSTIISSNLINNSFHTTRRLTVKVDISYTTDMVKALEVIKKVPEKCDLVLKNPEPNAWYDSFGESGITLVLAVWFDMKNLVDVKNQVFIAIKQVFDENGIEIPYNKMDVYLKNS